MISHAAILDSNEVAALLRASSLPRAGEWEIVQRISNQRRDPQRRQQFVVAAGNDRAFLTVGQDLNDLLKRTRLFTNAYPTLAPRLLGAVQTGAHMLILQEYIDGPPLLKAFPGDPLLIISALTELESVFAAGLSPSSVDAARDELKAFEDEVVQLTLWRETDREFLRNDVFPFLGSRLIPAQPKQRISNGDFIARNLLIRGGKRLCVIDYESAGPTHFHGEEWIRFGFWDELPSVVRDFLKARITDRPAWTVFLALRQLVLEAGQNRARPFLVDAQRWCREIRVALEENAEFRQRVPVWPGNVLVPAFTAGVQVFWETAAGWSEEQSATFEVGPGQHTLVFSLPIPWERIKRLRLDPMDLPGVACVQSVTLRAQEHSAPIFHAVGDELQRLTVAGDAMGTLLRNGAGLRVVCTGNDPQLYFPEIPVGHHGEIKITVVLSISPPSSDAG